LCTKRGIRVIAFINPSHADELEVVDMSGHWPALEAWKRALTAMVAEYAAASGPAPVELWDFSGYDAYSREPVPMDRHPMHWFWNTSHYTSALGELILRRIFGEDNAHFGVRLYPGNIEARLAEVRQQQRQYRELQPTDVRRIRDIYNLFVNGRSG